VNEQIDVVKKEMLESENLIAKKLNTIGNVIAPDVPISKDEKDNAIVRTWGQPSGLEVDAKTLGHLHHHQIMECLDMVEFERG
jgi:seryl-tRNA synthetase